jgi:hypothetical protein
MQIIIFELVGHPAFDFFASIFLNMMMVVLPIVVVVQILNRI